MQVDHLWLKDFRSYEQAELSPAPEGITVLSGGNGQGKSNLLEAVAYLATLKSFRGSPVEAMVRSGTSCAVIRAETHTGARRAVIEAEIGSGGKDRVQLNGQPLRRARDLLGFLPVTVFSPEDLAVVKGGPQQRRELLDELLVVLQPSNHAVVSEVDRALRQRNALLKSLAGIPTGRIPSEAWLTLEVWDCKLAAAGERLATARAALVEALQPLCEDCYQSLCSGISDRGRSNIRLVYRPSWEGELLRALSRARPDDLRRGVSTIGPQRDDLELNIGGLPARSHASQGEQRSLALALRLAGHRLLSEQTGTSPVMLLDDVFSELDPVRAEALVGALPAGQAILTTANDPPLGAVVSARYRVEAGKVL